ncbi:uncharacterized protein TNCV_4936031 [Trichonephila clavipes]|nr:uncharacterized protein TNCV_4936031 [Trichonephila clavipes]
MEVCEELGIAQSIISKLWKRFQDDGNVSSRYNTGRPRVTMPNEARCMAITAKRSSPPEHSIRSVSSAICGHGYDSFKLNHGKTFLDILIYMLSGFSDVFRSWQLTVSNG